MLSHHETKELKKLFNDILVKAYTRRLLEAPYGFANMLKNQKSKVFFWSIHRNSK